MDNLDNAFAALLGDCAKQGLIKTIKDKDNKDKTVFVEPTRIYRPTELVLICFKVTCRCCGNEAYRPNAHILRESVNAAGDKLLTTQISSSDTHLPRRIDYVQKVESMCLDCFVSGEKEVKEVNTDVDVIGKQRRTEVMTDSNPKANDDIFRSFSEDAMEQ